MPTTVAVSPRHLVLLPLPASVGVPEAFAAIGRLESAGALDVLGSVVVERQDDGTLAITPASPGAGSDIDVAAWRWLFDRVLDGGEGVGGVDQPDSALGGSGLSESFVAEVRAALASARRSLALVVARLDASAAVSALHDLPEARLVYGVLPRHVLERMLTRPPEEPPPARPSEI